MPFSKFEVVPETCGEPCFQKGSLVSGLLRLAGAKLFSEIMKDWVTRMLPIGWFGEILTGVGLRTSLGLWGSRGPTLIWVDQCVSVPYSHCGTALKGEVGGAVRVLFPMAHPPPFITVTYLYHRLRATSQTVPWESLPISLRDF